MSEAWEWLNLDDAISEWQEYADDFHDFVEANPGVTPRFAVLFTGTDENPGDDQLFARGVLSGKDTIWEAVGYDGRRPRAHAVWKPVRDQERVKWEADGTAAAARDFLKKRLE